MPHNICKVSEQRASVHRDWGHIEVLHSDGWHKNEGIRDVSCGDICWHKNEGMRWVLRLAYIHTSQHKIYDKLR
jgi:hypothetical protein